MSGANNIAEPLPPRGKNLRGAAAAFLCVEIVLIAWLFSGSSAEYAFPMFAAAVLCYAFCAFSRGGASTALERVATAALLLLCAVSAIQYFNPMYENIVCERYSHLKSLDFINWLPASVKAEYYSGNVFSSLVNISAALCVFAASLRLFASKKRRLAILSWLAINAVLMAIVACVQRYEKTPIIYNFYYSTADLFGSFPLSNAAGAFLNLGAALCVYLAFAGCGSTAKKIFLGAFWLCAAVFLSYAAYLSWSKGAALSNALFWVGFAFICLVRASAFLARRTSALFVAAAWCCAIFFALCLTPPLSASMAEVKKVAESKTVKESALSRLELYKLAGPLVEKRPLWGYGGGACAYVLPIESMKTYDASQAKTAAIATHAHCDILEYAIDYGLFGVAVILSILAAWGYGFLKRGRTFGQAVLFSAAVFCMAHSCVDLHLHIPSTMIALAIIMAASAVDERKESGL